MLLRIRLSENEPEEACDEKTLQEWARTGKIQAHHLIWQKSEQTWIQAKQWPSLRSSFSVSLWDAWEDTDQWELTPDIGIIEGTLAQKEKSLHKDETPKSSPTRKSTPPKLPLSAIEPIRESSEKEADSLLLRKEVQRRMERQKPTAIPDYESTTHPPQALVDSWNPKADLRDQPQLWLNQEPKKSSMSLLRIGLIVIVGLIPLVGMREWFMTEATSKFPLETEIVKSNAKRVSVALDPEKEKALVLLEQELKASLRTDIQEVSLDKSFSDALLIEMTYVDLNIQKITADVLSWKGRFLDKPKQTRISIVLNSNGEEMDREFALVSLIVAKYTERYVLDMETFSLGLNLDGTIYTKEIAVSEARNLLLRPGALPFFLDSITE